MAQKRNFTFTIQRCLLIQIRKRAQVRGSSFNDEMRRLIKFCLAYGGDMNEQLPIPKDEMIRTVVWLDPDDEMLIRDNADAYQRSTGRELVRMFAWSLEEISRRDLAIISSMINHQNQPAPAV